MKLLHFLSENILLILVLFLLAFIPLYPKLPLLDVKNTWVYIRIEDFLVAFTLVIYGIQVLRKKAYIKTPLTIPVFIFWLVGAIATISAIFLIFPHIQNAYPTVAVFHFLRRIEYLSLFFVAYSAMRDKKFAKPVVITLAITLLLVVFYGIGQKGFIIGEENRFPAYLTMNEEFSKGIPLKLSALARIPSTFAGHYDLAAYLVMLIAIMGSMVFGFKNYFMRFFFLFAGASGLVLLLLTASRVSFAVYLLTISFMLLLQKKKILIIPVIIVSIVFAQSFAGISQRFGSTISQVDLVVDARTGKAVGIAKEGEPFVIEDVESTGENLPKGTAYIKLPSQRKGNTATIVYKRTPVKAGSGSAVTSIEGNFVVQKVLAYDVSFTTRFQGEWPRAIHAFQRNPFLGSGYSTISLATDNNYLRILGEIGILGLISFLSIFLVAVIYVKKVLLSVDSPLSKSLVIGIMAGIFGLGLNAILIDVFEASKVAFVLWMLMGVALGLLRLYQKEPIDYFGEITKVLTSVPAMVVYLTLITFGVFGISFQNFFMGDDFTWLKWAADCKNCESSLDMIKNYFLSADGFFYRPGTKIYFYSMYAFFGLYAGAYHVMSTIAHLITAVLTMLISLRILKNKFFAFLVAFLFVFVSAHGESVYWIAATGHIIAAASVLFALLMYMYWKDSKRWIFLLLSLFGTVFGMLFHEFGIVTPLVIIFYDVIFDGRSLLRRPKQFWYYLLYLTTIPSYIWIRNIAGSHWFSGDYNYKLSNLPFNIFGNLLGYIALVFVGTASLPYYEQIRMYGKEHVFTVVSILLTVFVLFGVTYYFLLRKIQYKQWQVVLFGLGFFVITLLTFLGLGNITTRYVYLPSFGFLLLFVYLLQRGYMHVEKVSKIGAVFLLSVLIGAFSYYHYMELQRINADWYRSGEITNNLMNNFTIVYQVGEKTPPNPVFYFVNVPIRTGEAWIFPVGLDDALWFAFQNENLTVYTVPTLEMALDAGESSISARVFEFDKDGNVAEVEKVE